MDSSTVETVVDSTALNQGRQKRGRSMRNRCQTGNVRLKGSTWYGRYRRDVPGRGTREQVSLVLGYKPDMTKAEAKRKLHTILHEQGINTPKHLDRALRRVTTFKPCCGPVGREATTGSVAVQSANLPIPPEAHQTVLWTDGRRRDSQRRR